MFGDLFGYYIVQYMYLILLSICIISVLFLLFVDWWSQQRNAEWLYSRTTRERSSLSRWLHEYSLSLFLFGVYYPKSIGAEAESYLDLPRTRTWNLLMTTYSTEINVFRSQVRYPITPADPLSFWSKNQMVSTRKVRFGTFRVRTLRNQQRTQTPNSTQKGPGTRTQNPRYREVSTSMRQLNLNHHDIITSTSTSTDVIYAHTAYLIHVIHIWKLDFFLLCCQTVSYWVTYEVQYRV